MNRKSMHSILLLAPFLMAMIAPVATKEQIAPADLSAGDTGEGYTIFGSKEGLSRFDVKVLGIMHGFSGPGQDLIIAELSGPSFDKSSVVEGMSGSPVYVRGKLIGAVSYAIGNFAHPVIAGITPIKDMMSSRSLSVDANATIKPIALPLVVSGLSSGVQNAFADDLRALGFAQVRSSAASLVSTDTSPKPLFYPGSAVAAVLVDGDMSASAIGTVTFVDGDRVYAFGHPFLASGKSVLPMAPASIVTTVFSQAEAFKLGEPGTIAGQFILDRASGIVGQVGLVPNMVPMTLSIGSSRFRFRVVDDPVLLPVYASLVIANGLSKRLDRQIGGTLRLKTKVVLTNGQSIEFVDAIAAEGVALESELAKAVLVELKLLATQPYEALRIQSIDVQGLATPKVEAVQTNVLEATVKEGKTLIVRLGYSVWKQGLQQKQAAFVLPKNLPQGVYRVEALDGQTAYKRKLELNGLDSETSLQAYLNRLKQLPLPNEVCVYLEPLVSGKTAMQAGLDLPYSLQLLTQNVAQAAPTDAVAHERLGCIDLGGVAASDLKIDLQLGGSVK